MKDFIVVGYGKDAHRKPEAQERQGVKISIFLTLIYFKEKW